MGTPIPLYFGQQYQTEKSVEASPERLINAYVEKVPKRMTSQSPNRTGPIYGYPGLTEFSDLGSSRMRNIVSWQGDLYASAGTAVYKIPVATGTPAALTGTIANGTSITPIAKGRSTMALISEGVLYSLSSTAITQVTDLDLLGTPIDVTWLDGFFVVAFLNSDVLQISAVNDVTAFKATEFQAAETHHDNVLGVAAAHGYLFALGEKTTEQMVNQGLADFPFQRSSTNTVDIGMFARNLKCQLDGKGDLYFITNDLEIARITVNGIEKVSTPAVQELLRSNGFESNGRGYAYKIGDHEMFAFDHAGGTIVFDATQNVFHEVTRNGTSTQLGMCGAAQVSNLWYLGSVVSNDPKIFKLDHASFKFAGSATERLITAISPKINFDNKRFTVNRLVFDIETNVGNVDVTSPVLLVSVSEDEGRNWRTDVSRSIGTSNTKQVYVNGLGDFRSLTVRLKCTQPVKFALVDAWADVTVHEF